MTKRFISYGKIEKFYDFYNSIKRQATFVGFDEDTGEAIYNSDVILPSIIAFGTEKIHGTNASVCYSEAADHGFWVQSRKNIITPESDNAGTAAAAYNLKDVWIDIIKKLAEFHYIDLSQKIVTIYYEWCGMGIQKNTCVDGLSKRAIIFQHFKVSPIVPQSLMGDPNQETAVWYETAINVRRIKHCVSSIEHDIYNTADFLVKSLTIDLNMPQLATSQMIELTSDIETNSAIAKAFDKPENIGEGYVWTYLAGTVLKRWKVKGEKHVGKSRVKTKSPKHKDPAKEIAIIEFANYAASEGRMQQGWQEVFGINNEKNEPNRSFTGAFLKFMFQDILSEESTKLKELGLIPKDVNPRISKMSRLWFFERVDEFLIS